MIVTILSLGYEGMAITSMKKLKIDEGVTSTNMTKLEQDEICHFKYQARGIKVLQSTYLYNLARDTLESHCWEVKLLIATILNSPCYKDNEPPPQDNHGRNKEVGQLVIFS